MSSMASLGGLHRFSRWIHIGICGVQIVNICEEENPFRFQLDRRQRCQVVVVTEAHAVLMFTTKERHVVQKSVTAMGGE